MDDDAIRRIVRSHPEPDRLLEDLRRAPLVNERDLDRLGLVVTRLLPLTSQEVQTLRALGDGGLTIGEAADVLGCSSHTVKFNIKSAKAKLGAKTTMQAVARAVRQELI